MTSLAMHRKPVRLSPPAELVVFYEEEWAAPDDEASWRAFQRWQDARRAYGKAHPDSELGSALDQMRFERRVMALRAGWVQPAGGRAGQRSVLDAW